MRSTRDVGAARVEVLPAVSHMNGCLWGCVTAACKISLGDLWEMLRKQQDDRNYGYELVCCCFGDWEMNEEQRRRMVNDGLLGSPKIPTSRRERERRAWVVG